MGAFRKVTVTLEVIPHKPKQERLELMLREVIEKNVIFTDWGEHIVSIEVEPHPDDDFGEE